MKKAFKTITAQESKILPKAGLHKEIIQLCHSSTFLQFYNKKICYVDGKFSEEEKKRKSAS